MSNASIKMGTIKLTTKGKKESPILPQAKLLRLFQIMADLKTSHWKVKDLAVRYQTTPRTIYRYLRVLEAVEIPIECGFDKKYFIVSSGDDSRSSEFTLEEMKLIKKIIQTELDDNPLKDIIIRKLSLNSELDKVPTIIVKARRGKFVEQLSQAISDKRQVILKSYHSANSRAIADRLIEPIEFGDNYQTIKALDVKDKKCKQFKLERISEIIPLDSVFAYEHQHTKSLTDIFGMTGNDVVHVTLHLKMRPYLLLREDHPLSIPFLEQLDEETYSFHGPVNNFEGISRFVLGLLDEIKIIQPNDFKRFVQSRLRNQTVT